MTKESKTQCPWWFIEIKIAFFNRQMLIRKIASSLLLLTVCMITIITWGAKFKKSFASKETHTYDIFSLYVHLSHFFSFCIQAKAIYTICTLTLFYSIFLFGKAQETFENQRKIIHKQHHNHDNSYEYEKTFLVVENNVCILTLCVVCVKWLSYRGLWIEDRCCNNVWEIFRWFIHFSFKK